MGTGKSIVSSGRRRRRVRTAGPVISLALVLGACGAAGPSAPAPGADRTLRVVATTSILGDVVANVVGDSAVVDVLLPVGADPHDYEPSSQEIALIGEADLVVANGLALEEGLADALEAAEADGANVLEVAPLLDPIPFATGDGDEVTTCDPQGGGGPDQAGPEEMADPGPGACDPHVWNDPLRMAEAARLIGGELEGVDGSIDWAGRAERYAGRLEATAETIRSVLAVVPAERRALVTNHDSLGYFADRYGFDVVATVIPGGTTLAEPSSAELAELVGIIEDHDIPAIFVETIAPATLAEAVAAEVGRQVQVVELYTDSLGEPGSGADSLVGMLETDAERIASALG